MNDRENKLNKIKEAFSKKKEIEKIEDNDIFLQKNMINAPTIHTHQTPNGILTQPMQPMQLMQPMQPM